MCSCALCLFLAVPALPPASHPVHETIAWVARHGVDVRRSSIKGAGNGVFALVDLPARRVIGEFAGVVLTEAQYDAKYADRVATYVLQVGRDYIDASMGGNWTATLNDARGSGQRANVTFTHGRKVLTTRRIRAGTELFAAYGRGFWSRGSDSSSSGETDDA